jgi:MFS family permease
MALMRFAGDGIRNRYGAVATFRVSAIISALGMLVAGLSPWPWLTIAAFAISGLGVANMVPVLFSAAGNQPGVSSGAGMSVVTTMGYSGILVAPSVIGFVGGKVGFAPVYIAVALFLGVMVLMSKLTQTADLNHETVQDPVPI